MKTDRLHQFLRLSPVAFLPILTLAIIAGLACNGCSPFDFPMDGTGTDPCCECAPCRDDTVQRESPGACSIETDFTLSWKGYGMTTRAESWWLVQRLDIFVFNTGAVKTLDSYSRTYTYSTTGSKISSSTGERLVVMVANCRMSDEDIARIYTYEDLAASVVEFTSDSPLSPIMTGEAAFTAGTDRSVHISLYPIMSQIEIASLKCEMKGAWKGKKLEDVKVYLTGMSNRTLLLDRESFQPSEILNHGRLVEEDMRRLSYSGMSYKYLGGGTVSGSSVSYGSAALYCYPNRAEDESVGSPWTKLVIEGRIDGETCYYPIPVNRPGYGSDGRENGIGRDERHILDITVIRPGSKDPDIPVEKEAEITEGTFTLHPGNLVTGRDGESVHIWIEVEPEGIPVEVDEDDLDFDRERGIYDYKIDADGRGVTLDLLRGGAGTFSFNIGAPVNDIAVVIIVVNP